MSLALSAIAGCSSPQANGGEGSSKKLTAVTSADYPPFEFFETDRGKGKPIGFDVDVANYIAGELGYKLEIVDMDFNGIIPALQSKRSNFAMAGMTVTEERKQSIDFSNPYHTVRNALVIKKGSGIKNFEDLAGKKVGAQLGSTQEKLAKNQAAKIQKLTVESRNKVPEVIQEIKIGNFAAGVMPISVAKGFVSNNPDLEVLLIPNQEALSIAIAFPKGSELVPEFNKVLQEMKRNGKMDELTKKWFEDYYANQGKITN